MENYDIELAPTLVATDYKGGKAICFENHAQDSRITQIDVAPVLSAKAGMGGNNLPLVLDHALGFTLNDAGGIERCYSVEATPTMRSQASLAVAIAENIIGRKDENGGNGVGAQMEVSYTLNATGVHGVAINATVRRLLPVECERLMGFPDNHTRIPWKGLPEEECPDAPRYKACGNSMCVNVMRWIGERIDLVEKMM